jgi:hypothetical protein
MSKLLPYPFFILFSMISFNCTAIALLLQIDFLEPHENITKAIAWLLAAVTWFLVYRFRNK